jgi:hypothetical protein
MWSQEKIDRSANKARKASFDTSDFFAAALKKSYERSGSPIGISASTEQTEGATS